ncbi:MAG: GlmU family protein [Bacteroidetes bacterium]|nr:GlmU family protein [Bacteroidota bacterium]
MNYILFDDASRNNLLPIVFTRPVADIRIGILTLREKWEKYLNCKTSTLTEEYLSKKYPTLLEKNNFLINGSIFPSAELIDELHNLKPNQTLKAGDCVIGYNINKEDFENTVDDTTPYEEIELKSPYTKLSNVWEIFAFNGNEIISDFELITKNRKSAVVPTTNKVAGNHPIFIEEGARVEFSILNATDGPIYIGKDAEVMEGCLIRGPFALCESSILKMGAKVYSNSTIGPHSKAGGELNNVVFLGYSNKAHEGFLGNSVIGEWCNIGADTNTSNLKNTYEEIKLWNYPLQSFASTGLQFCGLIMGDHTKCGINTMFNTGTVVGVNANVFGAGFQRNFIPSFSWGGVNGISTYDIKKAIHVAERVYERRNLIFSDIDKDILNHVFNMTYKNRML